MANFLKKLASWILIIGILLMSISCSEQKEITPQLDLQPQGNTQDDDEATEDDLSY